MHDDFWPGIALGVFITAIVILIGYGVYQTGHDAGTKAMRIHAVQEGHGDWVTEDAGDTEFAWINHEATP